MSATTDDQELVPLPPLSAPGRGGRKALAQVMTALRAVPDGGTGQPVPVITIAYGDSAGAESPAAIRAATGGATYQASDPTRIRDVVLDAVGQRACRPDC